MTLPYNAKPWGAAMTGKRTLLMHPVPSQWSQQNAMACAGALGLLVTATCLMLTTSNGWQHAHSQPRTPMPNNHIPCPYPYRRHSMQELSAGDKKPYLFGGAREPTCRNCEVDHLWSHFCQYKSHGQLCNPRDVQHLIASYVDRNWTQMLTLTPCDMWPYIAGRTLWVLGDSQALDLYKALKCFFYEFWELDQEAPPSLDNHTMNVLGRILTPSCVTMPGPSRICMLRVDTGQVLVQQVLPLARVWASHEDLLLVNFGLHHGVREAYSGNLTAFAKYISRHRSHLPAVLWQQTPPQHFLGWQGEYPGGSPPFECRAVPNVTLAPDGTLHASTPEHAVMEQGGWRNAYAEDILGPVGIPIVRSYNESLPLFYYHRDNGAGYECTHYCFPSAQQTWVFALYRAMALHFGGAVADPTTPFSETPN